MPIKNYYMILGVHENESDASIHGAFRSLAKRYHPDVVGPEGTQRFQDILEAYRHLSNPESRARYNRSLRESHERGATRAEPLVSRRTGRPEPSISEPVSILSDLQRSRPSLDAIFGRFFKNFVPAGIPKGDRVQDLNLELVLSPAEAAQGGLIPLNVPSFYFCPRCGGSGRDWLFPCTYCIEVGMVEKDQTLHIRIPPMVPDRTVFEIPVGGLGIHNFHIRLHVRIAL